MTKVTIDQCFKAFANEARYIGWQLMPQWKSLQLVISTLIRSSRNVVSNQHMAKDSLKGSWMDGYGWYYRCQTVPKFYIYITFFRSTSGDYPPFENCNQFWNACSIRKTSKLILVHTPYVTNIPQPCRLSWSWTELKHNQVETGSFTICNQEDIVPNLDL